MKRYLVLKAKAIGGCRDLWPWPPWPFGTA